MEIRVEAMICYCYFGWNLYIFVRVRVCSSGRSPLTRLVGVQSWAAAFHALEKEEGGRIPRAIRFWPSWHAKCLVANGVDPVVLEKEE